MSSTHTPDQAAEPPFGCPLDEDCIDGAGHEGDCILWREWAGLPDPHRHNPFGVAVVLAMFFGIAWLVTAGAVLALIWGLRQ